MSSAGTPRSSEEAGARPVGGAGSPPRGWVRSRWRLIPTGTDVASHMGGNRWRRPGADDAGATHMGGNASLPQPEACSTDGERSAPEHQHQLHDAPLPPGPVVDSHNHTHCSSIADQLHMSGNGSSDARDRPDLMGFPWTRCQGAQAELRCAAGRARWLVGRRFAPSRRERKRRRGAAVMRMVATISTTLFVRQWLQAVTTGSVAASIAQQPLLRSDEASIGGLAPVC